MNRIFGMVMAAGLVLGHASVADAQVSLSIGNPYTAGGSGRAALRLWLWTGRDRHDLLWVGVLGLRGSGHNLLLHGHLRPPAVRLQRPPVYVVAPPVVVPYPTYGYRNYGYRRGVRYSVPGSEEMVTSGLGFAWTGHTATGGKTSSFRPSFRLRDGTRQILSYNREKFVSTTAPGGGSERSSHVARWRSMLMHRLIFGVILSASAVLVPGLARGQDFAEESRSLGPMRRPGYYGMSLRLRELRRAEDLLRVLFALWAGLRLRLRPDRLPPGSLRHPALASRFRHAGLYLRGVELPDVPRPLRPRLRGTIPAGRGLCACVRAFGLLRILSRRTAAVERAIERRLITGPDAADSARSPRVD